MPVPEAADVLPRAQASASERLIGPLRFLTCGSVDDGKSTLIGRGSVMLGQRVAILLSGRTTSLSRIVTFENIRRVAEVAKLMVDAGLIVLVSFISPFRAERRLARKLFDAGDFVEVYVDTPLAECERRDPKGLYSKARMGLIKNFTGIDSDYEPPEHADVRLDTASLTPEELVDQILATIDPAATRRN